MSRQIIDGTFDAATVRTFLKLPTITNLGAPSQAGQVGYNAGAAQLMYSDGTQWLGTGDASGVTLIYKPGYTGSSAYIFADWADLYEVCQTIEGKKYIQFDGSLNAGVLTVPAGTYDMSDVEWSVCNSSFIAIGSNPYSPRQHVILEDGVVFSRPMCTINGLLAIEFRGTTVPAITIDLDTDLYHRGFWLTDGAAIFCTGSQPFLDLISTVPGSIFIIVLSYGVNIINLSGTDPQVIRANSNVACILNVISSNVIFNDDTLAGAATFFFIIAARDFQKAQDVLFTVPSTQPAVTGSILYQDKLSNTPTTYMRAATPTVNDDNSQFYKPGDIWIDTTTDNVYICANNTVGAAVWRGPV